jgi:dTDP-glucose 4,6-dehydratase
MTRFVVTGGAGFIGSRFVEILLNVAHPLLDPDELEVLVVDSLTYAGDLANLEEVAKDARFKFKNVNICDEVAMSEIIMANDILVNFAAESHVDRSIESPMDFVETNIKGVANLLRISIDKEIKKFVQVSTDEVYGSIQEGSWDEFSTVMPNSPYSASKASADLMALAFANTYGLDVTITRSCNNLGPRQNSEKLIPSVINRLKLNEQPQIYGDGSNIREWIFVDDHCHAIVNLAFQGAAGEIYNIGSGYEISNRDLVYKIMDLMQLSFIEPAYVQDRKGHDFRYSVNSQKYRRLFPDHKFFSFDNSLKDTLDFYI